MLLSQLVSSLRKSLAIDDLGLSAGGRAVKLAIALLDVSGRQAFPGEGKQDCPMWGRTRNSLCRVAAVELLEDRGATGGRGFTLTAFLG